MASKVGLLLKALLLGIWTIGLMPDPSFGWGQEGHRIIAAIAEHRLHPSSSMAIRELLDGGYLREIGNWADDLRKERPETAPWHFVNIPKGAGQYDPNRDCMNPAKGDCLIAAIERFRSVLGDPRAPRDERADALKFLVHLVGDLHQPLHCIKDDDGGNALEVQFFAERVNPFNQKPWNLHSIWDAGLLSRADLDEDRYTRGLIGWLDLQPLDELLSGTVQEWAMESHRQAITVAYDVPADRNLGDQYVRSSLPVVGYQLAKAGARLAMLLNESFR